MGKSNAVWIVMSLAVLSGGCVTDKSALVEGEVKSFSGRAYDIDSMNRPLKQEWTQILMKTMSGTDTLVSQTNSTILQTVLQTSLMDRLQAEVTYYESDGPGPKAKLLTAAVSAGLGCSGKGCVEKVACLANGECAARIRGEEHEAKTNNSRVLGVLLASMNQKKAVENLDVEPTTYQIRHVKINDPS